MLSSFLSCVYSVESKSGIESLLYDMDRGGNGGGKSDGGGDGEGLNARGGEAFSQDGSGGETAKWQSVSGESDDGIGT